MNELQLQDKFLIPFFTDNVNGLGYKEVKANTITNNLVIEEDLKQFLKETELNKVNYGALLKKYDHNEDKLIKEFIEELFSRIKDSRNMALFFNINKSITFQGLKFYLFYVSESETYGNELFNQNVFSVVQELPYKYDYENKQVFSFSPDVVVPESQRQAARAASELCPCPPGSETSRRMISLCLCVVSVFSVVWYGR